MDAEINFEIRVVPYRNDTSSGFVVQRGRMVNGRWKTNNIGLRQVKFFESEGMGKQTFKECQAEAKRQAEEYAAQWKTRLENKVKETIEIVEKLQSDELLPDEWRDSIINKALLREASDIIDALKDQQAMPDESLDQRIAKWRDTVANS